MQKEKSDVTGDLMVIPLFDIVVYPESRTKFQVDRTTGNLFHVAYVQPADEGYVICAEVVQRVRIVSITEKEGRFFAAYTPVPDIVDLEDDLKTRILAEALGRKYVRISLGGVRDEAEIRGHRRTYVGALPGRIIQGIQKAGTRNPVFILDEIDKLAMSFAGDPASALLEVLAPEQNNTFSDHYLEVPYDLSDVLFIATANSLATIPAPLLDRMELIEISGYTKNEKFAIAKEHLIPETLEEHGLDADKLRFEDTALKAIIERYTREAGVRWLKKQLAKAARHVSEKIVSGNAELPFIVTADKLDVILGKEQIRQEVARKEPVSGVITGLA